MKYLKFPFYALKVFFRSIRSSCRMVSRSKVISTLIKLRFKELFLSSKSPSAKITGYTVNSYNYNSLSFLFQEVFLSDEYYFESTHTSPVIVDCGANIGFSVLYFKKLFPSSSIMAFEPNPDSFAMLQQNVSNNNLKDIQLNNIGLADKEAEIPFFYNIKGSVSGSLIEERGSSMNKIMVTCKPLSSFLRQTSTVDMVKMDVEGAEHLIVNDLAKEGLLSKPVQYMIEYHHNIPGNNDSMADFLKLFEKDYTYTVKANFHKPGECQDIMLHFIKK